jgi:hypothetical protein
MGTRIRGLFGHVLTAVGGGVIAVMIVGGGPAGAFNVPNNSVNSAKIVDRSIRGIDIRDATVQPADLSLRARPRWAKVDAGPSPSFIAQRGATAVSREDPGVYLVTFGGSVVGCGWSATLNENTTGFAAPGEIAIEASTQGENQLYVVTFDSSGVITDPLADDGFTVVAHC